MLYLSQMPRAPPKPMANITFLEEGLNPYFENDTLKCYGMYGCFTILYPFKDVPRPVNYFPEPPEKLDPQFCLYTRYNPTNCQLLDHLNRTSIYRSFLIPLHKTYFITHGFVESGDRPWIKRIAANLLKMNDVNVIAIDWGKGSMPPYTQAVANIRLVGRVTTLLIYRLMETAGLNLENVHLIGHSLGSHLSGYVGRHLKEKFGLTVGRITGMDPALPHFGDTDPAVRLDITDATFVDIIHSNARPFISGGLGIFKPIGHYDFYPNDGDHQPGCDQGMMGFIKNENQSAFHGLRRFVACDHIRSHEYFMESIDTTNCKFMSVECDSWQSFITGHCFPCKSEEHNDGAFCAPLGFNSVDVWKKQKSAGEDRSFVKFYTITNPKYPFCATLYRTTLFISNSSESIVHKGEIGQFYVSIVGTAGRTNQTQLLPDQYFPPGTSHQWVIGGEDVGEILSAYLYWAHHTTLNFLTWRFDPIIYIGWLKVETFDGNQSLKLCPAHEPILGSQNTMTLTPCKV